MNDRAVELLEQYDIEVIRTRKGRGAIVCDTADGCLIFKEYSGNDRHAELQNKLLQRIAAGGKVRTESIIPAREGGLLVRDGDGTAYILKTWQDGRECSISERSECVQAVKLLAKLHECMELPVEEAGEFFAFSPEKEYEKHNREILRLFFGAGPGGYGGMEAVCGGIPQKRRGREKAGNRYILPWRLPVSQYPDGAGGLVRGEL